MGFDQVSKDKWSPLLQSLWVLAEEDAVQGGFGDFITTTREGSRGAIGGGSSTIAATMRLLQWSRQ